MGEALFVFGFFVTAVTVCAGIVTCVQQPHPPYYLLGWGGFIGGSLYFLSWVANPKLGGLVPGLVVMTLAILWWYFGHKLIEPFKNKT